MNQVELERAIKAVETVIALRRESYGRSSPDIDVKAAVQVYCTLLLASAIRSIMEDK